MDAKELETAIAKGIFKRLLAVQGLKNNLRRYE
jgi:hypothetical protein